ncbi:hypothetical protein LPJ70_001933 [Coemansia sp. RSA 2708]|nr:hypothetical protein LPJ70_001933 [Coemansia sp. RSA 2708]
MAEPISSSRMDVHALLNPAPKSPKPHEREQHGHERGSGAGRETLPCPETIGGHWQAPLHYQRSTAASRGSDMRHNGAPASWQQAAGLGASVPELSYAQSPPENCPMTPRLPPRPVPTQAPTKPGAWLDYETGALCELPPTIFVPMPSMIGHSALSKDRSGDYIETAPADGFAHPEPDSRIASQYLDPQHFVYGGPSAPSGKGAKRPGSTEPVSPCVFDYEEDEDDDTNSEVSVKHPGVQAAAPKAAGEAEPAARPALGKAATMPSRAPETLPNINKRRKSQPTLPRKKSISAAATGEPQAIVKPEAAEDSSQNMLVDWKTLDLPEAVWAETQQLYDQVKQHKAVQNRQPVRMKHAILAAIIVSICRANGYPRTLTQVCDATKTSKREISMYLRVMKRVLGSKYCTSKRSSPAAFLQRWCSVLDLPLWVAEAATSVNDCADRLDIVQGKSPTSICAASMWLVVWCFNHRHALAHIDFTLPGDAQVTSACQPILPALAPSPTTIDCTPHMIIDKAGISIATITNTFKCFVPHLKCLIGDTLNQHL